MRIRVIVILVATTTAALAQTFKLDPDPDFATDNTDPVFTLDPAHANGNTDTSEERPVINDGAPWRIVPADEPSLTTSADAAASTAAVGTITTAHLRARNLLTGPPGPTATVTATPTPSPSVPPSGPHIDAGTEADSRMMTATLLLIFYDLVSVALLVWLWTSGHLSFMQRERAQVVRAIPREEWEELSEEEQLIFLRDQAVVEGLEDEELEEVIVWQIAEEEYFQREIRRLGLY